MNDAAGLHRVHGQDVPAQALVCFAVRQEAQFFTAPTKPITDVLITGIGVRNASQAVSDYLRSHQPRLILTCGFAGGLNPAHPLGQVLFDDADAGIFQNQLSIPGTLKGRFAHSDRVIVTAAEKAQLKEKTGADAVEMESSAIVGIGREHGIPVMVLRVISDTAAENLPMDFNRYSNEDGSLNMPSLLLGIAGSPTSIPALIRFQGRLKQAARQLGATLEQLLSSSHLF